MGCGAEHAVLELVMIGNQGFLLARHLSTMSGHRCRH